MKKRFIIILSAMIFCFLAACNQEKINQAEESYQEVSEEISQQNNAYSSEETLSDEESEIKEDSIIEFSEDISQNNSSDEKEPIELITYSIYGEIIENEDLRQELIKTVERCIITEKIFHGETYYADYSSKKQDASGFNYYKVNSDFAKTKDDLLAYFEKVFTRKYTERLLGETKSLDDYFFSGDIPLYKYIDGELFVLEEEFCSSRSFSCESLQITSKNDNIAEVVVFSVDNASDYVKHTFKFCFSNGYGWQLDEHTGEWYIPELQYFYHLFVGNAEKINKILSGNDTVLEEGNKVTIQKKGTTYEKIENFMTIKEMTDYFENIFTEDLANKYISEHITDVFLEENNCLYRSVKANKYKIPEFVLHSSIMNSMGGKGARMDCNWKNDITGDDFFQSMNIVYTIYDDYCQGEAYEYMLTSLKIASELPLIGITY